MQLPLTTLCYLEQDGKYLLMLRNKKEKDVNLGKWIGVGGHFEADESPEDCMKREIYEETSLVATKWRLRGVVTFVCDCAPTEYMYLYTVSEFSGQLSPCNEGELAWVDRAKISDLNLWEGDRIFLSLLATDAPFFSLKVIYQGESLIAAELNGNPYPLP